MGRQVNPELAAYVKSTDAALEARTGVRLTQLSTDFHLAGGGIRQAAELALASAKTPESFAADVETSMNLLPRDAFADVDEACTVNLRRASLVSFARENEGWKLGAAGFSGAAFKDAEQGQVIRMDVAPSRSGKAWGYAISVADDARLISGVGAVPGIDAPADRVMIAPQDAWFEQVSAGADIDLAIAGYNKRVENEHVAQPGM